MINTNDESQPEPMVKQSESCCPKGDGKAEICEFLGTFIFILTISLSSVYQSATGLAPIAIGFMLMTQVFAYGYISGAHFNPAITVAVAMIGQLPKGKIIPYIIAQLAGGICAGLVGIFLVGASDVIDLEPPCPLGCNLTTTLPIDVGRAFVAEFIYTWALVSVVLHVACSRQKDNNHYGLAIGMTVMSAAFSVGSVSGGAFNPAVATGLVLQKCVSHTCESLDFLWLYWAAPIAGAVVAGGFFKVVHAQENEEALAERDSAGV